MRTHRQPPPPPPRQLKREFRVVHNLIVHAHSLVVQARSVSKVRYICLFTHAHTVLLCIGSGCRRVLGANSRGARLKWLLISVGDVRLKGLPMWCIGSFCEVLPSKSHAEKDNPTSDEQLAANLEWQRQCQSVFGQQTSSTRKAALKQVRNAKLSRGAAYDHIRALDNAMHLAGIPLERFRADDLQKTSRPLSASQERYAVSQPDEVVPGGLSRCRLPVKDKDTGHKRWELPATPIPRGLVVLTIDQGSKMYSAQWYMQHVLRLRLVVFPDPHHRTWNDALLGVGAAGLKYLLYE